MNLIEEVNFDLGMFSNVESDEHNYSGVNVSDCRDGKVFEIRYGN